MIEMRLQMLRSVVPARSHCPSTKQEVAGDLSRTCLLLPVVSASCKDVPLQIAIDSLSLLVAMELRCKGTEVVGHGDVCASGEKSLSVRHPFA